MNDPTNKTELLNRIQIEHAPLEAILVQLTEEQMMLPGVEGKSSVKDILTHIAVWEQHLVRRLQATARDGKAQVYVVEPGETDDTDSINESIFVLNQHVPLFQVMSDFHQSFQDILRAVEAFSEEDLFGSQGLTKVFGTPAERIVGNDTFLHYPDHINSIRTWLRKQES